MSSEKHRTYKGQNTSSENDEMNNFVIYTVLTFVKNAANLGNFHLTSIPTMTGEVTVIRDIAIFSYGITSPSDSKYLP